MGDFFTNFASKAAQVVGSYRSFLLAVVIVVVWGASGPLFHYSDTWQLVINTGTTIVTFLMVFLIQNTQNRDAKAMHLKLDELIAAMKAAHNEMIDIEDLNDKQLEEIAEVYRKKKAACQHKAIEAIATDAAEQTAQETAERVAADAAKRTVEDEKERRVA